MGVKQYRPRVQTELSGIRFAHAPYCYRCDFDLKSPDCGVACAKDLKPLIETTTHGEIAAFMAETILGVGGFIVPPKEYFQIALPIVKAAGGLFIADEVQTAWGRTGGKWWGIQQYGVEPDILTSAKGMANGQPIGLTMARSEIAEHARSEGAAAVAVSARLESELAELDEEEAAAMRADLGLSESGLERVVHGAFALLDLAAFFTAGEDKPAQSWHLRHGLSVWHAAGLIHSDIQRGFVRAEVISWQELVDAGGYGRARERGTLRLEGRDYVVADGDVITVKFTP